MTGDVVNAYAVEDAEKRRDEIKLSLSMMVEEREHILNWITEAKENDDHEVLGYKSWPEYVSTEYADLLADLNREDRRFAAFALSQTGMSTRAIASVVGTTHTQVQRDLRLEHHGPVDRPATVTSLDGIQRPSTQPRQKPRRKPLPDAFHDATYDLSKIATRLENLHKDDRFTANRDTVRRHRADLFRAQTILRKLIADLGGEPGVLL